MTHILVRKLRPLQLHLFVKYSSTSSQTKAHSTSSQSLPKNEYFDVVISGGGMVGTSMALALGKDELFKDLKIALIESSDKNKYQLPMNYSNRVSALNKASVDLLKCNY